MDYGTTVDIFCVVEVRLQKLPVSNLPILLCRALQGRQTVAQNVAAAGSNKFITSLLGPLQRRSSGLKALWSPIQSLLQAPRP